MPTTMSEHFIKYLAEIATTELLTAEREIYLGTIIQTLRETDPSFRDEPLFIEARNELIQANLRLVVDAAKNFLHTGMTLEALTFEGNEGLRQAAERYNPIFLTRFSTYATWWITQAIRQAVRNAHLIRTPVRRVQQFNRIRRAQSFVDDCNQQDLSKIAAETGMEVDQVESAINAHCSVVSIHSPISEDATDDHTETMCLVDAPNPSEHVSNVEELQLVREAVGSLNTRFQRIINGRFGLDREPETLEDISKEFRVTRERIRQMEKEALKELSKVLKRKMTI